MEFVEDIRLGANSSYPLNFVEFNNKIYFTAKGSNGNEGIFSIDQNENVIQEKLYSNISYETKNLLVLNNQLYAIRGYRTFNGTFIGNYLYRINLFSSDQKIYHLCGNWNLIIGESIVYNNEIYFDGKSNCDTNKNSQLYAFNGSTTRVVGTSSVNIDFLPINFAIHNNELYFSALGGSGRELYKTNGLTVSLAKDLFPGSTGSNPFAFLSYNNYLYFARITSQTGGINDAEIFKYDHTTNNVVSTNTYLGSNNMVVLNDHLYFTYRAPGETTSQLARLDENDNLTLIPFADTSEPTILFGYYSIYNDVLYGVGSTSNTGNELYKYEVGLSVRRLEDYNSGLQSSNPLYRIGYNGNMYFGADNGNNLGNELHKYVPEAIAYTTIADQNFEQLLINLGLDTGSIDGQVPTANIESIKVLEIPNSNISNMNISNLDGIEGFTSLEEFTLTLNTVSNLDFSSNPNLRKVTIYNNPLESINLTQNPLLTDLIISNTTGRTISTVDVSNNTNLSLLDLGSNNISSIDISNNPLLKTFRIGDNPINTINLSQNINLEVFSAWGTNINSLDLSNQPNLKALVAYSSQLTELDLRNGNNANLNSIFVDNNPNLGCISVDNLNIALNKSNWVKDANTIYSLNCSTLGINNTNIEKSLFIYPNPVKSVLNIFSEDKIDSLEILDITGKTIFSYKLTTNHINVSQLNSGLYILKIHSDYNISTKRFIKQ